MVSPEHGESSSSPSADIYVSSARWGTAESAVRLELSDGSSFFIPIEQFDSSRFAEGAVVGEEERITLETADAWFHAWQKALDLAARREHTAFELKRKLLQRGFAADLIERVLREMRDAGYIDDRRFAEQYLAARVRRKPEGRLRLEQRLRSKGVAAETCRRVLDEYCTPSLVRELIEAAAGQVGRRRGELEPEEMVRELLKRGFQLSEARDYLKNEPF